jgi:hypothetical protein
VNGSEVSVPLSVRLRLGHAAIQYLADSVGVDVLHIKGAAVDPSLRPYASGTDIDLLVRPGHVPRLHDALIQNGWHVHTTFELGSPFAHAQTYAHPEWGFADVHRSFPGIRIDPAEAFERLWIDRGVIDLAGIRCPVPAVPAQALLLILNAARVRAAGRRDLALSWTDASSARRAQIEALVAQLDAPVAFAAAVGGLDRYRRERDYRLWRVVSGGGGRSAEWWARVRAAPSFRDAVRVAARAPLVNVEHLALRLGRRPTRRDIAIEFASRPARAVREAWQAITRRRRGA